MFFGNKIQRIDRLSDSHIASELVYSRSSKSIFTTKLYLEGLAKSVNRLAQKASLYKRATGGQVKKK